MLWLTLSMLLAPSAQAQDWECSETLTHPEWAAVMNEVDTSFRAFDIPRAKQHATGVQDRIRCLDKVVLPSHLGRYARQMSLISFFEQDEAGAIRWSLLQRFAAEELPWPPDMDTDHPARNVLSFVTEPPLSGPDNMGLTFPKKGAVFMNGELLVRPLARAEVPNLIQVTDKKGVIVLQYWQDGGAFRDELINDDFTSVPNLPNWFTPEDRSLWQAGPPLFEADPTAAPAESPPGTEEAADTDDAQATEEAEGTEDAQATEEAEGTEDAQATEEAEGTDDSQATEEAEGTDDTQATEEAEGTDDTQATEETESSEAPDDTDAVVAAPEPSTPDLDLPAPPAQANRTGPSAAILAAAGGLGLASGALYTTGYLSRGGLTNATNTGELAAARTKINLLAASAGVVGLGAVGLGVTAFVDGRTAGIHLRF